MKWLNENAGILSSCEQLRPVLDGKGEMIRGHLLNDGTFKQDPKGLDILHEPVPGQVQLADNDPIVWEFMNRKTKTVEQIVEQQMSSPAVLAVKAALNSNGAADSRIRAALRAKVEADRSQ